MSQVTINLPVKPRSYYQILVDGEKAVFSKNKEKKNCVSYIHNTTKKSVNISITSYSYLSSKLWLLMEIFFHIISIFSLLDMHERNKTIYTSNFLATINTESDCEINLQILPPHKEGDVVRVTVPTTNLQVQSNQYIINEQLKKRKKISKILKLLTTIGIGIAIFIFMIK